MPARQALYGRRCAQVNLNLVKQDLAGCRPRLTVMSWASATLFLRNSVHVQRYRAARVLERLEVQGRPKVYLIRNSCHTPDWKAIKPQLLPIALRTVKSLIRTQGSGDMFRVYLAAQRDGLDFHLADIPEDFDMQPAEQFDPVYMRQLFDLGHDLAKSGYPWKRAPNEF